MPQATAELVPVARLREETTGVFTALGFREEPARFMADSLIDADRAGIPSHGLMLLPMYVERILAGSVSRHEEALVVSRAAAVTVLDGRHALGHLTAAQAMAAAIDSAREHGLGLAVVRHAFHFGRAAQYAAQAARAGMIGVAAANTRPLMPAVGGAEPVVGNNPLAIAMPSGEGVGFTVDMAMSEAALGKIRLAAAEGRSIPEGWATDRDGAPTTDPTAAIAGMLLPVGGAKGFGLALAIDALTGALSGGAVGGEVKGLYASMAVPNDSAQFLLAIDVGAAVGAEDFDRGLTRLAAGVLGSRSRPGAGPVRLPGTRPLSPEEDGLWMERSTMDGLETAARLAGADAESAAAEGAGS